MILQNKVVHQCNNKCLISKKEEGRSETENRIKNKNNCGVKLTIVLIAFGKLSNQMQHNRNTTMKFDD